MAVEDRQHTEAVRTRIDMIVDAQETRAGDAPKKRKARMGRKGLIVILASFCVVIAGLVVAILMVNRPWENKNAAEGGVANIADTTENKVLIKCDDLLYKISNDENYSVEDAIKELEDGIEEDGIYKIYATMCYVNVMTNIENNGKVAIDKMLEIEDLVKKEDVSTQLDYYSTLRTLYQKNCDNEKYEYYGKLLNELSGDTDDDFVIENKIEFEVEE